VKARRRRRTNQFNPVAGIIMKTAIALGVAAALGLGIIGCTNSDNNAANDSNRGYGTVNTAGATVPGSENTGSNSSTASPNQSNQTAQPGINSNGDHVSNGPNQNTGQGNSNTQDAVSPTK
jgi:hypothetical protein